MTPDQAIEVARTSQPSEPHEWSPEAQNVGLRRGDWVSVTPDDYGNPVYGSLLAWTADEIVLRHEDPSVGKVNLRFPRVGFDTLQRKKRPLDRLRHEVDPTWRIGLRIRDACLPGT